MRMYVFHTWHFSFNRNYAFRTLFRAFARALMAPSTNDFIAGFLTGNFRFVLKAFNNRSMFAVESKANLYATRPAVLRALLFADVAFSVTQLPTAMNAFKLFVQRVVEMALSGTGVTALETRSTRQSARCTIEFLGARGSPL